MIAKCWKICLYVANTIFALVGVAMVASGIYLTLATTPLIFLPSWIVPIFIITGLVFLIIFGCGCHGGRIAEGKIENEERNWWLMIYAVIMLIFCLVEIGSIAALSEYTSIEVDTGSILENQISSLPKNQWQDMQDTFKCCGFTNNTGALATSRIYCSNQGLRVGASGPPCKDFVINSIQENSKYFLISIGAILFFAIMAFIPAICLAFCNPQLQSTTKDDKDTIPLGRTDGNESALW